MIAPVPARIPGMARAPQTRNRGRPWNINFRGDHQLASPFQPVFILSIRLCLQRTGWYSAGVLLPPRLCVISGHINNIKLHGLLISAQLCCSLSNHLTKCQNNRLPGQLKYWMLSPVPYRLPVIQALRRRASGLFRQTHRCPESAHLPWPWCLMITWSLAPTNLRPIAIIPRLPVPVYGLVSSLW